MSESITILSLDERDSWETAHADNGLPSQSWHYAWGLRGTGVEPRLAIVRAGGSRMLLPFVERRWQDTVDVATMLGISGASISAASGAPLKLWHEFAVAQGWIAGYIQLAATTAFHADQRDVHGRIVVNNAVLLMNLNKHVPFDSLSGDIRRKVRGAEKSGASLIDDRAILSGALTCLYPATMQRVGAAAYFHFPKETLEWWAADPHCLLIGASIGDEVQAIHLFLISGERAESHFAASSERGRELSAWLIWKGFGLLRDHGVKVLNLSGGMRPHDGIYRFKQGFGGVPTPRRAIHQIYDQARYDELCRQSGVPSRTDWFPAYRAPRQQGEDSGR